MLRRLGQSLQIALPREIVQELHLHKDDYLDVRRMGTHIVLEPISLVPRGQAYFHTPEWQKEEKKAEEDIQKGRVTHTKNAKELMQKLKGKRAL